ncbi:MAG: tetratricopeptide repeat protein [Planctomycetes bacterium]|nr:tetratricopeptide repeat protein [Planctomycetota bacterium]
MSSFVRFRVTSLAKLALPLLACAPLLAQAAGKDAWSLFRRRDYKAALEQMQRDARSYPEAAALHDGIGWCHYFLGAWDDAHKAFERALQCDPTYKWSRQGIDAVATARRAPMQQAADLLAAARYLDARALYQRIAAGETAAGTSVAAQAHDGDGWCAYQLGRYDEAIRAFQRALKVRADLASAARGIGFCKYAQQEWGEALVSLQLSLKLEPDHYDTRNLAGWCLYWKADYAGARREFQRAVANASSPWSAECGLGWCEFRQSREREALTHFQRAVELSPEAFGSDVRALVDARKEWWPLYRSAGWSALLAQDSTRAQERFVVARNLLGDDPDTLRGLAFASYRLGEYERALALLELCEASDANLPPVKVPTRLEDGSAADVQLDGGSLLGWIHYRLGQHESALARFATARAAHPAWPDPACGTGWVLFARGDIAGAEQAFGEACAILPGYADAQSGKRAVERVRWAEYDAAWSLFEQGSHQRALEALERLLARIDEGSVDAKQRPRTLAALGWALARTGSSANAEQRFAAAAQADAQLGFAWKGWGALLAQGQRFADAAIRFERAATCPDLASDAETRAMLGWARLRVGDDERALAAFEQALALDANSASVLSGLGATYLAQRKPIEARIELERAVRLDPTLEDADWLRSELARVDELAKLHSPLGWAWFGRGEWERAEADFRLAIERDPLEPTARRGLALTLIERGRVDEGRDMMGKYLASLPKKESPWGAASDVLSGYGWKLYALGDFAGALKAFRQLAELHSGEKQVYADPYDGMGWCQTRLGKVKDARESFLRAIAIQPRYESSLNGLETLAGRE